MSRGRARVALRALGWVGLALGFATFLLLAVGVHLSSAPGRRSAARTLVAFLDSTFLGSFELAEVSELSLTSLTADGFRVRDPRGRLVLEGRRIRARADVIGILKQLLGSQEKTTIVIEYARVEQANVVLAPMPGKTELGLVAAFTPRPTPPGPAGAPPPRVWLSAVEIGRANAHAELLGLPVLDGVVSGARGQVLISPVGVAVDAARFSAVVRGLLAKELRAVGSFHQRGTTHFWSSLDGYAGDLQFDSIVRLDGSHLDVTLDVPRGEPKVVRELLPDWPLEQTSTLRLKAAGDLPKLDAKATATVGPASLRASGSIELSPELRLRLQTEGEDIDIRAVLPDLPETRIDARSSLDIRATEHGVELTADGSSEPSLIGSAPLPASTFHAIYGAKGLSGTATLAEEGMPLSGSFVLEPGGALALEAHAPRFLLERAPRVAQFLAAKGGAEFRLKGRLEQQKVDATLSLELDGLTLGGLSLKRGRVGAHAVGPIASARELRVDGSLSGNGMTWAGLAFDDVEARVSGPLSRLSVSTKLAGSHGTSVEASAQLRALGGTELDTVDIALTREGRMLHGRASHVVLHDGSVEVADVQLEGAGGTLVGSGRYRPGLIELDARGQDLDLEMLTRLLGVAGPKLAGKVNVNAELVLAHDVRRGSVSVAVRDGVVGPFTGVVVDLSTTLERENVAGNALVEVAGLGRMRSSFDTTVTGSLLELSSWRAAVGRLDLGLERVELARLTPLLPADSPVRSLAGVAVAQATVLRETPELAPSLALLVATDGLVVVMAAEPGKEPLTISGIEAQVSGNVDGTHDFAQADCRLIDGYGLLLAGSARIEADVQRALENPREAWSWLKNQPFVATAVMDGRPLGDLPEWLKPGSTGGTLRLEASLRGTPFKPTLAAKAGIRALVLDESSESRPFDVCGTLQYDPEAKRLGLGAQAHLPGSGSVACTGTRVAVGRALGTIDLPVLLRGERGFDGDAEVGFEDLPLELLSPLAEAGMTGRLRGTVALSQGGERPPALSARLKLADVTVRKVPVGAGDLTIRSDGRLVSAEVALERGEGRLDAEARAALVWDRVVPRFDAEQPFTLEAAVHDIDAALLSPLVSGVLADLSGRLDGDVRLAIAPDGEKRQAGAALSELSGELSLRNGALQLSGLGMRLSNVKFQATAKRNGARTVIAVRELSAASGSKFDNVAASADIYLEGLKLVDARANVNVRKVPLLIEGVSQATLTGSAALELLPERVPMLVAISLHELTAELPRSSGRSVLSVEDNPDIAVKQPLREPVRAARGDALSWQLAFDLARKVKVVRADMEIPLRGRPVVTLAETTTVTGDLELSAGGRVQLLGKGFIIESGEVHFDTGEPGNPHLRVLGSWRAPDATIVYVEVGGTLREATLRLQSDPALSPAEIEALLLGGGSGDGGEAQAAGVGYGADFVGELLADTPLKRVELRTANETSADDRSYLTYTAAVPVSETLWVELSYKNLESSGPAEHTDAASAIIDWRFKRDWSLRTEAGTIGTGLDLLWQYRY